MSEPTIEKVILGSLIHNPFYYTVVLPHTKKEFFESDANGAVFEIISNYHNKYGEMPSVEAAEVELSNVKGLTEELYRQTEQVLNFMYEEKVKDGLMKQKLDWLLDKTEARFKDRSSYLAIVESLEILEGRSKLSRDAIPGLLEKAVAISFTSEIGHDYLDEWEKRFREYHKKVEKIPFSLHMLNRVTEGGYERKTLSLFVSGTNVGKTMTLTNESAHLLMLGKNVLYITLEMAEEKISERSDAKLLQVPMAGIKKMEFEAYRNNMLSLKSKTSGKLIIQQFPPRTITVRHIEALLNDLKAKRNFVPDVICVDYMTLLNSYSMKTGGFENLYILGKLVAEELRALAIRRDVAILSASQTNRNGQANTDFDITDLGESHAISQTADFMVGLISTPELELLGQLRMKLLKSRFGPLNDPNSFIVGIERAKMTLFDVDYKADSNTPQPTSSDMGVPDNLMPSKSENKFKGLNFGDDDNDD